MNDRGPYFNGSGCPDPTAYEAMKNLTAEVQAERDEQLHQLIHQIRELASSRGFDVLNRIELRDRITGKIYR